MTYKDVLDAFRKIYDSMNIKGFEIQNAFHTIDEVIWEWKKYKDSAEKYKWHDLRKNPNDLPKADGNGESDYVLCIIGNPTWNHWEQAYYDYNKKQWSTYENNVIAWKEIEPFEVGE